MLSWYGNSGNSLVHYGKTNMARTGMLFKKLLFIVSILLLFASSVVAGTVTYQYDQLGRLTQSASPDGAIIAYAYDAVDNRLSMQVTAGRDSDGDGLPDALENAYCTLPLDADSDDDGIPDGVEDANHNGVLDAGETNPCHLDTDGDGIQDGTELGYTLSDLGPDTNQDLFQPDLDPATQTNPLNADTDGDGRPDGAEDLNCNGRVDAGETDPSRINPRAMPWLPLLLLLDGDRSHQ